MDKKLGITLNKKKLIIVIALVMVVFSMVFITSYAWYQAVFSEVFVLEIDASGILYLYLEVPVHNIGDDTKRYLTPAVAMPHAVSNGMYMNPLVVYNPSDANPSWIQTAAIQGEYKGDFTLHQGIDITNYVQYKITMKSDTGSNAQVFSNREFIYSDISFVYTELRVVEEDGDWHYEPFEVYPLVLGSQSEDLTTGVLEITNTQTVFFSLKIYLANVDELIDTNIFTNSSIWCEIALTIQGGDD